MRDLNLVAPVIPRDTASVGVAFDFIAPTGPAWDGFPGEEFQVRAGAALLNKGIDLARLSGMLALSRGKQIDLPSARGQRAHPALDAEQQQFRDVSEVKPHPAPVRPAIFSDLVPHEVRFIGEAPGFHDHEALAQEGIGHPQIQVGRFLDVGRDGKFADFRGRHRAVAAESAMLRGDFARPVLKPPRRVREDRGKTAVQSGKMFAHRVQTGLWSRKKFFPTIHQTSTKCLQAAVKVNQDWNGLWWGLSEPET